MSNMVDKPIEYARDIVGKDPIAMFLGINVDEVKEGYARCSITVKPEYLNAVERAHGSIIHAVADQAFAVACNSMGSLGIALSMTLNYLAGAADGERIFAEAMPIHVGRKISTWRIEVRGVNDTLIASGESIAYHKS
jgi:acyl-CoA thioesterase